MLIYILRRRLYISYSKKRETFKEYVTKCFSYLVFAYIRKNNTPADQKTSKRNLKYVEMK